MTVETNQNIGDESEFDSKKLQVGDRIYYIDMKENRNGRFIKLVEGLGYGRMSRLIVPISIAPSFIDKLRENNDYHLSHPRSDTDKKAPSSAIKDEPQSKPSDMFPMIIHTSNLFIQNRRFYFDLREHKDGYRRLRISYVMKTKRINLSMVTDALPNLIEIMDDYVNRFADESVVESPAVYVTSTIAASHLKEELIPSVNPATAASPHPRSKRTSVREDNNAAMRPPRAKKASLVVSEKPAPVKQPVVNKVYSLEVVTGEQNAFIRMTELIGNSKKSTFHVPLEGCAAWKDAIVKFVNQISAEDISNAAALRIAAEAANLHLKNEKTT